ncbi:MAG: creatininase family protein [Pirellulales bacterium]
MHAQPRPWMLEECTLACAREHRWDTAVIPLGATEPHNLHLPYGTDMFEAEHLAEACCRRAWELGGKVVQLPVIPYGTETNLAAFPLALNLMPSTITTIFRDLLKSLEAGGIRKLLLFNSHGGNDFKPMMRELYGQSSVQLFLCNWYQMIRDKAAEICENPDDHAGEMETSLIMAYRPELVRKNADGSLVADDGSVRPFRYQALTQGWVAMTRPWHLLTTQSGSGNPHRATAAKGKQLHDAVVDRIGPFLAELAKSPVDERFPFA